MALVSAEALERDPHSIGWRISAFDDSGPVALIFERTDGSSLAPDQTQHTELKGVVQLPPPSSGLELDNWHWKAVRAFVWGRLAST